MTTTFAELGPPPERRPRCAGCGAPLDDPVRLNLQAQQNQGRPSQNWLYRQSVQVCEPCGVAAVEAALARLGLVAS